MAKSPKTKAICCNLKCKKVFQIDRAQLKYKKSQGKNFYCTNKCFRSCKPKPKRIVRINQHKEYIYKPDKLREEPVTVKVAKAFKYIPLSVRITSKGEYWILNKMIDDCIKRNLDYVLVKQGKSVSLWRATSRVKK